MPKINLLPHREQNRLERQKSFYTFMGVSLIIGALVVLAMGGVASTLISVQGKRNSVLVNANKQLNKKIKEVSTLKQEIAALKARQQAVEDLQADRNQPVYLMEELVLQTPEGIYLTKLKQTGQRVLLSGYAQSNDRVSEYLYNLNNRSPWLQKPELIEIKAELVGKDSQEKRVFAFMTDVGIKRPRDKEQPAEQVSKSATNKQKK